MIIGQESKELQVDGSERIMVYITPWVTKTILLLAEGNQHYLCSPDNKINR
ncbi:MAG: hypothetical protein ACI8UX_001026 [Psychromonas sp.]|jgi:hypothetical protein